MSTKNGLKRVTKDQNKGLKQSKYLNDRVICLLGETHDYQKGGEILAFLTDREKINDTEGVENDKVFVDFKHACFDCEEVVKTQKYAIEVNKEKITYPYEPYYDAYIETGFENLITYSNMWGSSQHDELVKLLNDLKASHAEKNYDIKIETEQQKLEFLRSQDYYIEGYRQPLDTNDKNVKYILHWPPTRSFTLPEEAAAIQGLSTIPVITLFNKRRFVIYREAEI
jgi:hypothetical protein